MTADLRREAIAAVDEEIGRALTAGAPGVLVVVELDPNGDGVLLVRNAGLERADQLTWQIEQLLHASDRAARRPKLIVGCAGVSGARPLAERPDLVAVLECLDEDGCSWVAVCAPERIARSITTTNDFLEELRRRGAALYVGHVERSVLDPEERLTAMLLFSLPYSC